VSDDTWGSGRRTGSASVAGLVAALLCLPAGAAAALLTIKVSHERSTPAVETIATASADAVAAARVAAHDVLSYDYRTINGDIARAKSETTGEFAQQYASTASQLLAQAKQVRAIVQAKPSTPGVVTATSSQVVVLVFVDQLSVKEVAGAKTPTTRIDQSRVRMTMTRVGDRWLVSQLAAL
jgi:Mce-associated membrane protein